MAVWLERYKTPILFFLLLLLGGGFALLLARRPVGTPPLEIVLPSPTSAAPKLIKVYVTGAVACSGVYEMREGDRIEEALRLAGGATPDADLTAINLAARVRDEMRVHVPRPGEPPLATDLGPQKININTASAALLDTLPNIGPVTSAKIMEHRSRNGPFQRIEDLRDLKLVSNSTFEKIKDLIAVR